MSDPQSRPNEPSCIHAGGVVLVFDRVMHYHRATLQAIDRRLADSRIPFTVLSALDRAGTKGRVADAAKVVASHEHFGLSERRVAGFQLRYQHGLLTGVRRHAPSVVISTCHSGTFTEWQLLRWARRHGVRRVSWQCGYEYNPGLVKRVVLGRFVPQFDFHLCYHTNARRYSLQHGAREDQTLVMHNTIDERAIRPASRDGARRELEARHPELAGKRIVLYVGAVLDEKRLERVMEAFDRLAMPDAIFLVVGDGPHLPALKARYAARRDWLSVGAVVQGVGVYFDAADVFVLPGTGGLAINEAMAHRLPVLSGYADGSADDLVIDGETGFRLREDTAEELADRLRRILADPQQGRTMGERGEQRIRGPLSFESFIDRVVGVLQQQHRLAGKT
ncbi:MAG: glycosyltransferase family 4 protein [Proteobacteria bacterium]|nr:glycosyltransferase family 4 protein [Pseudomonadota bacterium]